MPKHRWKDESLVKCATIDASLRIKEAAKVLQDERLLLAVQGEADLMALDVVYPKSCYRSKTRQKTIDRLAKQASEKACAHVDEPPCASSHAFAAVFQDVQCIVINGGQVVRLTQICKSYVHHLQQEGEIISCYRTDLMLKRLEKNSVAFSIFNTNKYE